MERKQETKRKQERKQERMTERNKETHTCQLFKIKTRSPEVFILVLILFNIKNSGNFKQTSCREKKEKRTILWKPFVHSSNCAVLA